VLGGLVIIINPEARMKARSRKRLLLELKIAVHPFSFPVRGGRPAGKGPGGRH